MKYVLKAGGLRKKLFRQYHSDIQRAVSHMKKITSIYSRIVGTSSFSGFRYFGDVDLMSSLTPGKIDSLARKLQSLVRNLPGDVEFSDMKAGAGRGGGLHWSKREVLNGRRSNLTLAAALRQRAVTKIDLLIPVKQRGGYVRYVELTNFFFIPSISKPFGDYVTSMDEDIAKYSRLNRKLKVLKRTMSKLLWTGQDKSLLNSIRRVLTGKAGKLASLVADCETARLLKGGKRQEHLRWIAHATERGHVTMRHLPSIERELQVAINDIVVKSGH